MFNSFIRLLKNLKVMSIDVNINSLTVYEEFEGTVTFVVEFVSTDRLR